jgi:hypothetical protein
MKWRDNKHSWVDAALHVCCTWCMLYLVYAVLGVCCIWCMLYWVDACTQYQLMIMTWTNGERWLHFVFLHDDRVMDENERDGDWGWEQCGVYEQIGQIRGTTWLIRLGRPCICVIVCGIGTYTWCIGDGKSMSTQNSLKFQFPMLICLISSHRSRSHPQLHPHLSTLR